MAPLSSDGAKAGSSDPKGQQRENEWGWDYHKRAQDAVLHH